MTISSGSPPRLRVVFLGTPDVVLPVLAALRASQHADLVLVVTAPPARRGRGAAAAATPTPVELWAREQGLPCATPASVREPAFLQQLLALAPDICVTAAYGQFLPRAFLDIPRFGTLNLHPSLLPELRGAAPVQRALEAGLTRTGITLLFSTLRMDAGPLVDQTEVDVSPQEDAQPLLLRLFGIGAGQLEVALGHLRAEGQLATRAQDEDKATHAPKLTAEEAYVDVLTLAARSIVNRIRAFAPWPGVKLRVVRAGEELDLRILAATASPGVPLRAPGSAWFEPDGLMISCKSGESVLKVTQLQLPGKRVMSAAEVRNGWPAGAEVKLAQRYHGER